MESKDQPQVIVLAGGFGTRLRPVVGDRPKALVRAGGLFFIEHLFKQIELFGVSRVTLAVGIGADRIKQAFGDRWNSLSLSYSQERLPLGTAGALRLACEPSASAQVVVMNGDSYCEVNLNTAWSWHLEKESEATLLLTQVRDAGRFGSVVVDKEGKILEFREKESSCREGCVNAGIYFIQRKLIADTIPTQGAFSLERDIFPKWINKKFYGYATRGKFIDIGTPESYGSLSEFF